MKQGKLKKRLRRTVRKVISGGTTRLIKPAAITAIEQPNEPATTPANDEGLLRLKTEAFRLPSALAEASETSQDSQSWMIPGRVVLTISVAAIVFIIIITWFISQMPPGK